jgi:fucose 4-O-acetylase-like acetyltransferase
MRRLVLSRFLSLLFPYLAFLLLFLLLLLRARRSGSCGGFISGFYTHSKRVAMDPVLDGVRRR